MTLAVEGLAIAGAQALRGQPTLPGDKSISHRALMLGLLAEGRTSIRAASEGQDVRSTRAIVEPLRAMGATIAGEDGRPPVRIRGRRPLRPIEWTPPVASAQVKSAILLAGLRAEGVTRVHEPIATRDHTERMLRACGVTVRT